jgi:hypothetical protein
MKQTGFDWVCFSGLQEHSDYHISLYYMDLCSFALAGIGFVLHNCVLPSGFVFEIPDLGRRASDFRPKTGIGFVFSNEPQMNANKHEEIGSFLHRSSFFPRVLT